ncbi:alpha/beta fold hydrolase [Gammaproteobacteria bacterium]|nr:alpha/beta fold hydrolase [Gammaproteobacteria bacterium]
MKSATTAKSGNQRDQRPALVLVHGFLGGADQWQSEVDAFADRFNVITPTLPGFGGHRQQAALSSIDAYAGFILDQLDQQGIDHFSLLGHSMGGMIAQHIALCAPERIDHLVLYGTGPLGKIPGRFESLEDSLRRLQVDGVESTAQRIGATWFADGENGLGFDLVAKIGATSTTEAACEALQAMANWDGRAAMSNLDIPTLIIWGEKDRSYRWSQIELLWTKLPQASLAVVPGASHALHLEKPAIFHALLNDYLSHSR